MDRLTQYSNDLIRNKAVNILRKLDSKNGLNSDDLALISSFCLIERVENNQLKKYEDLEEQEKLLKLPCAFGDTVYTNCLMQGWYFRKKNRPYEAKVVYIGINGADNHINVDFGNGCMLQFTFSDIGKTIFFTEEEAEAALKELEGKEV